MPPYKTSLIIPVYTPTQELVDMTRECLESLKYGRPDEIIVVHDGWSRDLMPLFSGDRVRNVLRRSNGGYCKAVNTGMKEATGNVIILGNNDITFTPGWLEGLLKPLEQGYDIGIIRVSDSDGFVTEDKITEDDKFGSLFAMTRHTYEILGGFDETFRDYFGDLDYRRRALDKEFRIGKNHAALVEHIGRATYDTMDTKNERFLYGRQIFLNKWGFIE